MSNYHGGIFGNQGWPDTTNWEFGPKAAALLYRLGAILDRATELREKRDGGGTLTDKETHFVVLADRMLEIGIEAFADEGKV